MKAGDARAGRRALGADTAVVLTAFVVSRALARRAGLRLDVDILQWAWQVLDLPLLRDDLAQSLLYLHAQPPIANAIVGLALKAQPVPLALSLGLLNHALGWAAAWALLVSLRRAGVSPGLRTALAVAYTASPSALLYEHFVASEHLVAACLAGATALLLGFAASGRPRDLAGGVGFLVLVALTRSLFHVVWLAGALALVLTLARRPARRILPAALAALLLTLAWYGKNAILFGSFSASTWLGMNLAGMTTAALPGADRDAWVAAGRLSPVARVHPFSPLDRYAPVVALPPPRGVPAVDAPRKVDGSPNFNHAAYVPIARFYASDAVSVLRERPDVYAAAVTRAALIHLLPASDYDLIADNLAHLAPYRALFDGILGGGALLGQFPSAPLARFPPGPGDVFCRAPLLALGLPVLFVASVALAAAAGRDPRARVVRLALALACWNVAWVAVIGSLFEMGENNRFRVAVNPCWVLLAGILLQRALTRLSAGRRVAPPPG